MTDSTGPKRVNYPEGLQLLSTDLNLMSRFMGRALCRVLQALFRDESRGVQSGVLDGLVVSAAASGALAVDVTAGIAFLQDATGISDTDSDPDYRWIELFDASADVALDAADPGDPRIDLVYVTYAQGALDAAARNVKNPTTGVVTVDPAAEVTYGPRITVQVETGTPAAVPAAPATPAGAIALALVTVNAGAVVPSSLADARTMLPVPQIPGTLAGGTEVAGDLSATGLTSTGTLDVGASKLIVDSSGNLATDGTLDSVGQATCGGFLTATGNMVASAGNVQATAGDVSAGAAVSAGTTVTGGTGVTATTGDVRAAVGAVSAGTTVTGGTGVMANTGNVAALAGKLTAAGLTAIVGDDSAAEMRLFSGSVTLTPTLGATSQTMPSVAHGLTGFALAGAKVVATVRSSTNNDVHVQTMQFSEANIQFALSSAGGFSGDNVTVDYLIFATRA